MSTRDLMSEPVWQAQEAGRPIPDSLHAVSVALPRWQDVVAYEEKAPQLMSLLRTGYPRFVVHPLVQQISCEMGQGRPSLPFPSAAVARLGALITFLPRRAESRAAPIYDSLALCKGPSFGTLFSLACPFTLLAHYCELDWAESCGVSRHLLRLSVGLEPPEAIGQRLDHALSEELRVVD